MKERPTLAQFSQCSVCMDFLKVVQLHPTHK